MPLELCQLGIDIHALLVVLTTLRSWEDVNECKDLRQRRTELFSHRTFADQGLL